MKKCPYCAEDVQDEAIVCKHCGRDLTDKPQAPPQQVQIVQPKKKTGCIAAGCAVAAVFFVVVALVAIFRGPGGTPPPAGSPARQQPALNGKGAFGKHAYQFKTETVAGRRTTVFIFERAIKADDALFIETTKHLLSAHYGVSGRITTKQTEKALRFIAASGIYDAIPVLAGRPGKLTGITIMVVG